VYRQRGWLWVGRCCTGFTWSLTTNASGGSITPAGVYTAGPTASITDVVQVGDSLWNEASRTWAIPYVDWSTWKALGAGRESSRRLADEDLEAARKAAAEIVARFEGAFVERGGKRCRVVGRSAQGGVRVDGGPGGFKERTVSLTDLGWVFAAKRDVAASGAVLDEARVNRLRYLEGTPRSATRWIDTGWAILLASV
jgi:hypothetical protein